MRYGVALRYIDTLPSGYREAYITAMTICKDVTQNEKNKCEAAYLLAKCIQC